MALDMAAARDRDRVRWHAALIVSLAMHVALFVLALAGSDRRRLTPAPSPVVVTILSGNAAPRPPTTGSLGFGAAAPGDLRSRIPVKSPPRLRADRAATRPASVATAPTPALVPPSVAPSAAPSPEPSAAPALEAPGLQGDVVVQAGYALEGRRSGRAADGVAAGQASQPGPAPRILAPAQGDGQLAIDPNEARYQPVIPPRLRRPGAKFAPLVKLCVGKDGSGGDVTVVRPSDPAVDPAIVEKIRLFRFRPYLDAGHPIPFCFYREYRLSVEE